MQSTTNPICGHAIRLGISSRSKLLLTDKVITILQTSRDCALITSFNMHAHVHQGNITVRRLLGHYLHFYGSGRVTSQLLTGCGSPTTKTNEDWEVAFVGAGDHLGIRRQSHWIHANCQDLPDFEAALISLGEHRWLNWRRISSPTTHETIASTTLLAGSLKSILAINLIGSLEMQDDDNCTRPFHIVQTVREMSGAFFAINRSKAWKSLRVLTVMLRKR